MGVALMVKCSGCSLDGHMQWVQLEWPLPGDAIDMVTCSGWSWDGECGYDVHMQWVWPTYL